jgi:hypothetical protein
MHFGNSLVVAAQGFSSQFEGLAGHVAGALIATVR